MNQQLRPAGNSLHVRRESVGTSSNSTIPCLCSVLGAAQKLYWLELDVWLCCCGCAVGCLSLLCYCLYRDMLISCCNAAVKCQLLLVQVHCVFGLVFRLSLGLSSHSSLVALDQWPLQLLD